MGWKTIVGTVAIAVGNALIQLPEAGTLELFGEILVFFGTILTGVGIRHAIAKGGN